MDWGEWKSNVVWQPYEITLLSNQNIQNFFFRYVWQPYEITLLSNVIPALFHIIVSLTTIWNYTTLKHPLGRCHGYYSLTTIWNYTTLKLCYPAACSVGPFDNHMKLHYSQTKQIFSFRPRLFDNHMKLHYSQTQTSPAAAMKLFDNHMKLHYSQTVVLIYRHAS